MWVRLEIVVQEPKLDFVESVMAIRPTVGEEAVTVLADSARQAFVLELINLLVTILTDSLAFKPNSKASGEQLQVTVAATNQPYWLAELAFARIIESAALASIKASST